MSLGSITRKSRQTVEKDSLGTCSVKVELGLFVSLFTKKVGRPSKSLFTISMAIMAVCCSGNIPRIMLNIFCAQVYNLEVLILMISTINIIAGNIFAIHKQFCYLEQKKEITSNWYSLSIKNINIFLFDYLHCCSLKMKTIYFTTIFHLNL